jgi:hypothetical protein
MLSEPTIRKNESSWHYLADLFGSKPGCGSTPQKPILHLGDGCKMLSTTITRMTTRKNEST